MLAAGRLFSKMECIPLFEVSKCLSFFCVCGCSFFLRVEVSILFFPSRKSVFCSFVAAGSLYIQSMPFFCCCFDPVLFSDVKSSSCRSFSISIWRSLNLRCSSSNCCSVSHTFFLFLRRCGFHDFSRLRSPVPIAGMCGKCCRQCGMGSLDGRKSSYIYLLS